jgi:hypothetical protein
LDQIPANPQTHGRFSEGATPFFTLNWSKYAEFLTSRGGLDPVTGGLWVTDIAHHHLAIAIIFLIAGHMYRTNWGIGHGLKDILEAHKRPFTGQGHKGLYEILTTSWHAQLAGRVWGTLIPAIVNGDGDKKVSPSPLPAIPAIYLYIHKN